MLLLNFSIRFVGNVAESKMCFRYLRFGNINASTWICGFTVADDFDGLCGLGGSKWNDLLLDVQSIRKYFVQNGVGASLQVNYDLDRPWISGT